MMVRISAGSRITAITDIVFPQTGQADLPAKVRDLTRGRGMDAVIEVTGSSNALALALDMSAGGGRVSLLGCTRVSDTPIDFYRKVHKPGITIVGAHNWVRPIHDSSPGYWTRQDDYRVLLALMSAGRLPVRPVISEIASPSRAGEIYARLAEDPQAPLGIVFDWHSP